MKMFNENLRLALTSLYTNKTRTLLTMLGIIIGIASVIAIMTVGDSLTLSISDQMKTMGANNIEVILSERKDKVINTWTNGLGDINKYLNGQNPLPKKKKKADASSWKCIPFDKSVKIECNIVLTKKEFEILFMGHIPEVMEDHWFMYCDENSVNYFRSWTGIQIFKGYYRIENETCIIYSLEINNNKEEYNEDDINKSRNLFNYLINSECKIQ